MKSLTAYLNESLIINRGSIEPKNPEELRQIILKRYKKYGPGTKNKPINLNDIDVSKIDSFYNGTIGIFERTNFVYIDISDWDVSNIKNMYRMFNKCKKLKSVGDLSDWDVSNVEYMSHAFANCESLEGLDISNWDVSNVKDMQYMFYWCKNFNVDLSMWDVRNVKNMRYMFDGCRKAIIPDWYEN